jgi:hypothetical protein
VPLVDGGLLTLPEHMSPPPVLVNFMLLQTLRVTLSSQTNLRYHSTESESCNSIIM